VAAIRGYGAIAVDTLKLARRPQEAGVSPKQAEAETEAIQEALDTAPATKSDIIEFKGEIATLRWMIGFELALTAAILGRLPLVH